MANEKIKREYADMIAAAKKKWDESSPELKEAFFSNVATDIAGFLLWWDTLKEIEKRFNIDVMNIAREMRYKWAYDLGQKLGKNYKEQGMKVLYDAYDAQFEGVCEFEWIEFNDEVRCLRLHHCPCIQFFIEAGRTDEEIKEMTPLFCLRDIAVMRGICPDLEIFAQPRLKMMGDPWCSYHVEDNRAIEHRLKEQKGK